MRYRLESWSHAVVGFIGSCSLYEPSMFPTHEKYPRYYFDQVFLPKNTKSKTRNRKKMFEKSNKLGKKSHLTLLFMGCFLLATTCPPAPYLPLWQNYSSNKHVKWHGHAPICCLQCPITKI